VTDNHECRAENTFTYSSTASEDMDLKNPYSLILSFGNFKEDEEV